MEYSKYLKQLNEGYKSKTKKLKESSSTFTLKDAIKIASTDYNVGVASAIDELESMGFDCDYYWDKMYTIDDDDDNYDEINLETRDELFDKLGIKDLMSKAYDTVWNSDYTYKYQIEYWADEEARENGFGDIYGSYETLEEAKHEADRLFDSIAYDGGSVEVQDLENDCEVVYFLEPTKKSKKRRKALVKEDKKPSRKKFTKKLKESAIDVRTDLVDRALLNYEGDVEEAVRIAIDDGLIYTDDIFDIASDYVDALDVLNMFYDDLFSDLVDSVEEELGNREDDENLNEKKNIVHQIV